MHKKGEDAEITSTERIQWVESDVNEPIDSTEFTLASLGLRPGDVVSDNREGIEYRCKNNLMKVAVDRSLQRSASDQQSEKTDEVAAVEENASRVQLPVAVPHLDRPDPLSIGRYTFYIVVVF